MARGERIEREAENKAGKRNEKRKERRRSERCKDIEIEEGSERKQEARFSQDWKNICTLLCSIESFPPLSFFLWTGSIAVSSVSAIPLFSIFQSFTIRNDFRAPPFFFSPPLPSLPHPSPLPSSPRRGQRASENMNPSSRPHCLGCLYLPRAHRRNLFGPLGTRTRVRACVRACDCLLAGGDKDRSWRVGWDEKNRGGRGRDRGEPPSRRWRMVKRPALSGQTMIYRGYVRNFHN